MTPDGATKGIYYIGKNAEDFYFDYNYNDYDKNTSIGQLKVRPITEEEKNNTVFIDIPKNLTTITKTINLSTWNYKSGNTYYIPLFFNYPDSNKLFNIVMESNTKVDYRYTFVEFYEYRNKDTRSGSNTKRITFQTPQSLEEKKFSRQIFLEVTTSNPGNLVFTISKLGKDVTSIDSIFGSWKYSKDTSRTVIKFTSSSGGSITRMYFKNRAFAYEVKTTFSASIKKSGVLSLTLDSNPIHYYIEPEAVYGEYYVAYFDSILFSDTFRRNYDNNPTLIGTLVGDRTGREICFKEDNTYTMKIGTSEEKGTYSINESTSEIILYPENLEFETICSTMNDSLILGDYYFDKY